MSDARRSQLRAVLAFVAVVGALGAAFAACTSYQRANGEGCLKDADCLSSYCVSQVCGEPPPVLNGTYEEAGAPDTGTSPTPGPDSSSSTDSSGGVDAPADGPAAPSDSGKDARNDAAEGDAETFDANDASDASDAAEMDAFEDASDASDAAEMDAFEDASDAAEEPEMDASDATPDANVQDASTDDASDAFNVTTRPSFVV